MRIAVCPGSYDPVTNGHVDVIRRACQLFDEVHVVVGVNAKKGSLLPLATRLELLERAVDGLPAVVRAMPGLLAAYVAQSGACAIVKGLRGGADLDYEQPQAAMNRELSGVDTVFLLASPDKAHLSSTVIKDVAANGGDITPFVPPGVAAALAAAQAPSLERPGGRNQDNGREVQ